MINIHDVISCPTPSFSIGQEVKINFNTTRYGRGCGLISIRRHIIQSLCSYWQSVKLTNDPIYRSKLINEYSDVCPYLSKERKCLGKLWDEKKTWIRKIISIIDNDYKAHILYIEPCEVMGLSTHSLGNLCYLSDIRLLKYWILIYDPKTRTCFKHSFLKDELLPI